MTTDVQTALSKTRSMKMTLLNAIGELGVRSEEALEEGKTALGNQLAGKANDLGKQAADIRRVEDRIRAASGLTTAITELDQIAEDARKALRKLEKTSDAIADAAKLAAILANVVSILA